MVRPTPVPGAATSRVSICSSCLCPPRPLPCSLPLMPHFYSVSRYTVRRSSHLFIALHHPNVSPSSSPSLCSTAHPVICSPKDVVNPLPLCATLTRSGKIQPSTFSGPLPPRLSAPGGKHTSILISLAEDAGLLSSRGPWVPAGRPTTFPGPLMLPRS